MTQTYPAWWLIEGLATLLVAVVLYPLGVIWAWVRMLRRTGG